MMTTEEKRRLWLDAFHAEMRGGIKHVESGECNMDELADSCREWADIIVAHASRLMPDFAEPVRVFDREVAKQSLQQSFYAAGGLTSGESSTVAAAIIDGKIPGVKYTPPTTTNPG